VLKLTDDQLKGMLTEILKLVNKEKKEIKIKRDINHTHHYLCLINELVNTLGLNFTTFTNFYQVILEDVLIIVPHEYHKFQKVYSKSKVMNFEFDEMPD
jgi:hypothetical protein